MKKLAWMTCVGALATSQLGATDCGQVLRDPGFDLWCGADLCTWKVVRGDIRQVGTWNKADSGVELLGEDTAIQQLAPVNSMDGDCIRFSLVANVDETAEVFLDVDMEADGRIEQHERIPTSHWKPLSFLIFMKGPFDGVRFELNKKGVGHAVLAQIQAELSNECAGFAQLDPGPRPNGASCIVAADCASNLCIGTETGAPPASPFGTVCVGCTDPGGPSCGAGMTCGVGDALAPILAVPLVCVPSGAAQLAETCLTDGECASGKCYHVGFSEGVCSACMAATDCGGAVCNPSWVAGPYVCRPGEHAGAKGTACGANADCTSGSCTGTDRKVCSDGRPCETPANCPVESGLAPGACTTVGIQGGTCD